MLKNIHLVFRSYLTQSSLLSTLSYPFALMLIPPFPLQEPQPREVKAVSPGDTLGRIRRTRAGLEPPDDVVAAATMARY